MPINRRGFTLIELMIVVAIIGILAAIAIPTFSNLTTKSKEGSTKGNLGTLRSALQIYYGDNENIYPMDDLTCLTVNTKYLEQIPLIRTPPYHIDNISVIPEYPPTDTGEWSYDNSSDDATWGAVVIGCQHSDLRGNIWTSY